MKIVVITCYFGKLPWYLKYFLYSCSYNPSIDFFIITDDHSYDGQGTENVHFVYETLEQISAIASSRFGFQVTSIIVLTRRIFNMIYFPTGRNITRYHLKLRA